MGFRGPLVQRWMAEGLWPDAAQPAPTGRDASGYSGDLFFGSFRERTIHHVSLDDDRDVAAPGPVTAKAQEIWAREAAKDVDP